MMILRRKRMALSMPFSSLPIQGLDKYCARSAIGDSFALVDFTSWFYYELSPVFELKLFRLVSWLTCDVPITE